MKKISALLISIALVAALVGCSMPVNTTVELDINKPWWSRYFVSETARYDVIDYRLDGESKYALSNDDSFLEFKIYESTDGVNSATIYVLDTDYQISYPDPEKNFNMHSTAKFDMDNLYAIYTEKEVLSANANYYFEADYVNGIAKFAQSKSEADTDSAKIIEFPKGNYVDNEYLYYYIRAMKGLTTALEQSSSYRQDFAIVNWFECFSQDKFSTSSMSAGSAISPLSKKDWENIKIDNPEFIEHFDSQYTSTEDDGTKLINSHCVAATLMDDGKQKGQAHYAYYTQGEYNGNTSESAKTQKILLKLIDYYSDETDVQKDPPQYNNLMEITLKEYSIK